jgi:hypothetical protein
VLQKHSEQFECVAMRSWRAAEGGVHLVEFVPRPTGLVIEGQFGAGHLALDRCGIESHLATG